MLSLNTSRLGGAIYPLVPKCSKVNPLKRTASTPNCVCHVSGETIFPTQYCNVFGRTGKAPVLKFLLCRKVPKIAAPSW